MIENKKIEIIRNFDVGTVPQPDHISILLSLKPEKEAKRAFRNRNAGDASYPHKPGENGSHMHSARACRFLNARIALHHSRPPIPIDRQCLRLKTSKSSGASEGKDSIEGFQFRCIT